MEATAIIGREDELGSLRTFLAGVERGPSALVLSGEPGIGKTLLWETGVKEARERLGHVLTCRAVEAEASLSFAALSDLVGDSLEDAADSLAPPRRRALEVALLLAEPGDAPPDAHAIGLAVLDLLRVIAAPGPLLLALDDVQWLDHGSAGALQVALRRLRSESVAVLATLRRAPDLAAPFPLEHSFPEERLQRLSLGPLSLGALHKLLEERLGLELTRPELVRVQEATAGNPFFALELGRELMLTNTRPDAGRALHVPDSLRDLLGGRLAQLPGETADVLLEIAALARPTVELVAAAHGDEERVLRALEAARRERVIELDDSRLRFTHPLLASICYEEAPVWKRRAVHRALASVVSDAEERARHLALAAEGPDAAVASNLEAAAAQAAARGATAAAGELSELGAALTPDDPALTRRRLQQAANFHFLAGDRERSVRILDQLLVDVPAGHERADVLYALASTFRADAPATAALCDEALAEAADDDTRSARILTLRAWNDLLAGDVRSSLQGARAALELAERVGDPPLIAAVIGRVAQAESWAADVTPGLVERGVEIEDRLGLVLDYRASSPRHYLPRLLMRQGEIDRPRALIEELEARAAARGDEGTRAIALWYLAIVEWLAGRWQRAVAHASAAEELASQIMLVRQSGWIGRVRALLEVDLGLVDEARASIAEGLTASRAGGNDIFSYIVTGVLGRLEFLLGNLTAAADHLRELPTQLLARGVNDPTLTVWPDAIETLIAVGELERAREYLASYDENSERLPSPWGLAAASRCRGLLTAAEGEPACAFAAFEQALATLAEHPYPLERARTLLALGVVRRQAQERKAAREALDQAVAIFDELGARLWAEKARAELARISGRRSSDDELTETEHRVATLAAQGRSNKEIAAELFMGVSTVEAHLSRVYRKLGIRSRTALGARLAMARDTAAQG